MAADLGAIDSPKALPRYLNDYLTGYLAFGACAALYVDQKKVVVTGYVCHFVELQCGFKI